MMKKVNFNALEFEQIDGTMAKLDIRREFSNFMYMQGDNIESKELGRKIYNSKEEIELTDEEAKIVKAYAERRPFGYVVTEAIINAIK